MATRLHQANRATTLPLGLISQAIPKLRRTDLVALTERLIDRLDELDGDPDEEDDDPAGQCDEDGINTIGHGSYGMRGATYGGPGCPISDDDHSYY